MGKVRKRRTSTSQNIADFIVGVLSLIIIFIVLISNMNFK